MNAKINVNFFFFLIQRKMMNVELDNRVLMRYPICSQSISVPTYFNFPISVHCFHPNIATYNYVHIHFSTVVLELSHTLFKCQGTVKHTPLGSQILRHTAKFHFTPGVWVTCGLPPLVYLSSQKFMLFVD